MARTIMVVLALVLVVAVLACGGTPTNQATPAPAASTPTAAASSPAGGGGTADGEQVFADNCAGCHKEDGSGGFGPNIQSQTDVNHVVQQVTNGGAKMPAFKGQLTDAQIQAVATYVVNGLGQ